LEVATALSRAFGRQTVIANDQRASCPPLPDGAIVEAPVTLCAILAIATHFFLGILRWAK
jgi:hypothetical protein